MDTTKADITIEKEEQPPYSKPEIEELELNEGVTPEMPPTGRSGMGNCKHTYI